MARGRTQFRFHGGLYDGAIYNNIASIHAHETISHALSTHAIWSPDGKSIGLVKRQDGRLSREWLAVASATYRKERGNNEASGVDYAFVRARLIGRCAALSKNGKQCRNKAAEGSILCCTSHKEGQTGLALVGSEALLGVLESIAFNEDHPGLAQIISVEMGDHDTGRELPS